MNLDLEKLKAAALAASSGPWTASKDGRPELHNQANMIESDCRLIAYGQLRDEDAAYIAALNPAVALELIAEVERLREWANSPTYGPIVKINADKVA